MPQAGKRSKELASGSGTASGVLHFFCELPGGLRWRCDPRTFLQPSGLLSDVRCREAQIRVPSRSFAVEFPCPLITYH